MRDSHGFTLVELVVVIAILGILAATAMPKFVGMDEEAEKAALAALGGALGSSGHMNFLATVSGQASFPVAGANVCNDVTITQLIQGGLPVDYHVSGALACVAGDQGKTGTCTLTKGGYAFDFIVTCSGV